MLINRSNQCEWLNFNQSTMQLNLMGLCNCEWNERKTIHDLFVPCDYPDSTPSSKR